MGHGVAQLVEALRYKPEGRGFEIIFHWYNPSGLTMALWLTQPQTEMSTRNISCGLKTAGAYGWQPYHLHVSTGLKSGSLILLEPSGPVQACHGIALPLPLPTYILNSNLLQIAITKELCGIKMSFILDGQKDECVVPHVWTVYTELN